MIVGVSVAYNFQIGSKKIKLLTEYEDVTQTVLFGNAVLAALMFGRIYGLGVIDQFLGLCAHLILRRLISSCGDTLRTLFTRPL
jgi:hypothetical protein